MNLWTWNPTPAPLPWLAGPNDGGIKRGDREETGDNEAGPDDFVGINSGNTIEDINGDPDGMTILNFDDPQLGMTHTGRKRSNDWATETGEERNEDGSTGNTGGNPSEDGSILGEASDEDRSNPGDGRPPVSSI